jgi:hypothetical protein
MEAETCLNMMTLKQLSLQAKRTVESGSHVISGRIVFQCKCVDLTAWQRQNCFIQPAV